MLSLVLRSERAVHVNILIVRAFIKIKEILASNKEIAAQIAELQGEQKLQNRHTNRIYELIEKLIAEPVKLKGNMGLEMKIK